MSTGRPPMHPRTSKSRRSKKSTTSLTLTHPADECEDLDIDDVMNESEEMGFGTERQEQDVGEPATMKPPLKRKMKRRAAIWGHLTETLEDGIVHGICNYCNTSIAADSRVNGTSPMKTHLERCPEYPENKQKKLAALKNNIHSYVRSSAASREGEGEGELEVSSRLKFDQEATRNALRKMVVVDELPFKFVENEGFRHFVSVACPAFIIPSRFTLARDCLQLYLDEKSRLQRFFQKSSKRVCLTTDAWTSNQNVSNMCLTAHFIDDDWNLQKRILNFIPCPSHKGDDVGILIEKCLNDWGIDKVFTITIDNAFSNDKTVGFLKRRFASKGTTICEGEYMHMRCVPHIINLAVKDGLKDANKSINRVRAVVKYIRQSPARMIKFKKSVEEVKIKSKKLLCLDVPTRWNSVYIMLSTATVFQNAFIRYELHDPEFHKEFSSSTDGDGTDGTNLSPTDEDTTTNEATITDEATTRPAKKDSAPTINDWLVVDKLVKVLGFFYELTVRVSGSSFVTSNLFLDELSDVYEVLMRWSGSTDDPYLQEMARKMKLKFEKYWGEAEKMNQILFVACMLDPCKKFSYVQLTLKRMYGETIGTKLADNAKKVLTKLYAEYKKVFGPSLPASTSNVSTSSTQSSITIEDEHESQVERERKAMRAARKEQHKIMGEVGSSDESDLEKYLSEKCTEVAGSEDFKILEWWKIHAPIYPILSKLASDVFAMPISTVSSESAFSTGGRVISDFRASLSPRMAQALICAQDWIREDRSKPITYTSEEDPSEIESIERELVPCESAESEII